jgi:hypothetical protein
LFHEAPCNAPDPIDVGKEVLTGPLGSGPEALEAIEAPVAQQDRDENLFVVYLEVVDASFCDGPRVAGEVSPEPW